MTVVFGRQLSCLFTRCPETDCLRPLVTFLSRYTTSLSSGSRRLRLPAIQVHHISLSSNQSLHLTDDRLSMTLMKIRPHRWKVFEAPGGLSFRLCAESPFLLSRAARLYSSFTKRFRRLFL